MNATRNLLRLALLVPICMGTSAVALGERDDPNRPVDFPALNATAIEDCGECAGFGESHIFIGGCDYGDPHCRKCGSHGCHDDLQAGPCHGMYCAATIITRSDVEALESAIQRPDVKTIEQMLVKYPQALYFNEQRSLIQWLDCVGSVYAQQVLPAIVAEQL